MHVKKADIEQLIGTDHEVRIQAPNSSWRNAEFGQVLAVGMYQGRTPSWSRDVAPIRNAVGNEHGGAHVIMQRRGRTVEEVVPYSHIHAETKAEYDKRVERERVETERRLDEQEKASRQLRERTRVIRDGFAEVGITVRDDYSRTGGVSMKLDMAEQVLELVKVGRYSKNTAAVITER